MSVSIRTLLPPRLIRTTLLRAPTSRQYSSTAPTKRLLQTATTSTSPSASTSPLPPPPPPPLRDADVSSALNSNPNPPRKLRRPRKSAISLTQPALRHLRDLLSQPVPKLIRIGVRNRGCSGLAYHLEYVDRPGVFDEEVVQDGVKVLIDSKALFSIIGSEMDWVEDKLSARFVFRNPNIKEQCGCGESFSVG